ncbi:MULTISPECIES: ATP-binding protein [Streptomyces]|uniref:ATP-binding protein n=1 Tax=Streptomyces koelreuteriae TaxID=2838015 RepID=A0ABX8FU36_9ACTN|nr:MULTISPECIES: ATP-binding protein [Streptomyces]QWB24512.1 ATP-binding protein [Streptomyces koelreuteriae]UUA07517.1 ATP-binding protein [Streptomyces koelreuteriae]UUA15146.1 ATP-binding protein [Streptomyces sp. CRCS-T-1]
MDAGKTERLAGELDAYAHWFVRPEPSFDGHFLTLTLFAEFGDTARVARDMTAVFLRGAGADAIVGDAQLVVSELVGNVVNHAVPDRHLSSPGACRRIDVIFKMFPKWLFIGVADEDSTPPLLPTGEVFSPGLLGDLSEAVLPDTGRGLLILQRLTAAIWWTPEERGGKTVWCRFDLNDEVEPVPH